MYHSYSRQLLVFFLFIYSAFFILIASEYYSFGVIRYATKYSNLVPSLH